MGTTMWLWLFWRCKHDGAAFLVRTGCWRTRDSPPPLPSPPLPRAPCPRSSPPPPESLAAAVHPTRRHYPKDTEAHLTLYGLACVRAVHRACATRGSTATTATTTSMGSTMTTMSIRRVTCRSARLLLEPLGVLGCRPQAQQRVGLVGVRCFVWSVRAGEVADQRNPPAQHYLY